MLTLRPLAVVPLAVVTGGGTGVHGGTGAEHARVGGRHGVGGCGEVVTTYVRNNSFDGPDTL
jgi:hypothetical protein